MKMPYQTRLDKSPRPPFTKGGTHKSPSLGKRGKTGGTEASPFVKGDRKGIWEKGVQGKRSQGIQNRKQDPYGDGVRLKGFAYPVIST